jgi:tetratricopeptide (TPR) repeat protein
MLERQPRRRARWPWLAGGLGLALLLASLGAWWAYENDERVYFHVEAWRAEIYDVLNPRSAVLPTAAVVANRPTLPAPPATLPASPTLTPSVAATPSGPTATPAPSATPTTPPTPLPSRVELTGFRHEYQKFNNCGPASLAVSLSFWSWPGSQTDAAAALKPNKDDKNVSPIEMYDFLLTIGYDAYIRVNGDLDTLKRFLAAGYPVLVEKGLTCQAGENCSDWFGHYSVVSGYDDAEGYFILQDTFRGPNLKLTYAEFISTWRAFNYLYLVAFPADPTRDEQVRALLGPAADLEQNYRDALARAQAEALTLTGQDAAFAWFNVGTTLHYMRDYGGAAAAYDQARNAGLPYRMAWYQFGPYRAYYYMARYQDVVDIATFAINSTPKPVLEEAYYWRGQAYEALGLRDQAIEDYRTALDRNPTMQAARDALAALGVTQ